MIFRLASHFIFLCPTMNTESPSSDYAVSQKVLYFPRGIIFLEMKNKNMLKWRKTMVSNLMMGKNFRKLNLKLNFVGEHVFYFLNRLVNIFFILKEALITPTILHFILVLYFFFCIVCFVNHIYALTRSYNSTLFQILHF